MSGYKLSGMTQEEYQARLAFAVYNNLDPDTEDVGELFEDLDDNVQDDFRRAAAAVRDDTRTEPRW